MLECLDIGIYLHGDRTMDGTSKTPILRFALAIVPLVFATLLVVSPAFAKDHAQWYQVGIFSSTGQLSDGTFANCYGSGCNSYSAGHNIHYIRTQDGMYAVEAPISVGLSLLGALATEGNSPTIHKEWFMDQLHEGDKVLFAAACDKHNNCQFWLPNPDKVGKEFSTMGYYRPDNAKTNTGTLCGTGKLKPEIEAQVCPAKPTPVLPEITPHTMPAASALEWKTYSESSEGFSAAFPSQPTMQKQDVLFEKGSIEVRSYLASDGETALLVDVCDYSAEDSGRDPDSVLDRAQNGVITYVKGHLIRGKRISFGNYHGVEFETDNDTLEYTTRIYLVGSTLYQTMTVAPLGNPYINTIGFLDSFQLIARTSTGTLCGKDKLKPDVEAQVCPANPEPVLSVITPPAPAPAPIQAIAPNIIDEKNAATATSEVSPLVQNMGSAQTDGKSEATVCICHSQTSAAWEATRVFVDGEIDRKSTRLN